MIVKTRGALIETRDIDLRSYKSDWKSHYIKLDAALSRSRARLRPPMIYAIITDEN